MWKVGQAGGEGLDAQKRLPACNVLMSFIHLSSLPIESSSTFYATSVRPCQFLSPLIPVTPLSHPSTPFHGLPSKPCHPSHPCHLCHHRQPCQPSSAVNPLIPRDIFNAKFLDQDSISQTYLLQCVLILLCIMRRFCDKLVGAGCTEKVTCLPCYNEFRSSRQVCAMWWREEEIGQLKQLHKLHFLSQQHLNNPTTVHKIKSHIRWEILTC